MADHLPKVPSSGDVRSQAIAKLESLLESLKAGEELDPLKLLATIASFYRLVDPQKLQDSISQVSEGRPERSVAAGDNQIQNQLSS